MVLTWLERAGPRPVSSDAAAAAEFSPEAASMEELQF
jgi:hypothetical protein